MIELTFTPVVSIGGWNVRLEALALAGVLFAALVLAAGIARRTPLDPDVPPGAPGPAPHERNHLRADDLLFVVVAAVPGAVLGGRLGDVLSHPGFYGANPGAVLDVSVGGLELSLAVLGGSVTGAVVAGLLDTPPGRWMHALALPLLLAIAGGKAAMLLGGSGQGRPWDGPLAVAYAGPGPWGSAAPALASHPAQAYEAAAAALVLVVLAGLLAAGRFRRRSGAAFLLGVALWAGTRAAVAVTWRDGPVLGPLGGAQAVSIGVGIACLLALAALEARVRSLAGHDAGPESGVPRWPDPERRPRI